MNRSALRPCASARRRIYGSGFVLNKKGGVADPALQNLFVRRRMGEIPEKVPNFVSVKSEDSKIHRLTPSQCQSYFLIIEGN